ncbi:hypothetical protein ACFCYX_05720 [Streptomyces populi]|uniref:hypothetical protein n=1 Tax=Streptomyces populi TaxID=2058924 RepID=UPI0035DD9142
MAQEPAAVGPHAPAGQAPAPPPGPVELADLAALEVLAHPRRQRRVLRHLTPHGPARTAHPRAANPPVTNPPTTKRTDPS